MSTSTEVLALLFLSVLADAADVELANNTNFLLLILLALLGSDDSSGSCCNNNCGCNCSSNIF